MRVLLADDHVLVRAAISKLVSELPGVTEVLEASNGREAIEVANESLPDIVLMDIGMPVMNGFEAMSRILKELPGTRVIMFSMYEDEEIVWRALRLGAKGYLAKTSAFEELERALRTVAAGEVYLSPHLRTPANDEVARGGGAAGPDPQHRLTPRQREILQMIAEG